MGNVFTVNFSKFTSTFMYLAFLRGEMCCLFRDMGYSRESGMKIIMSIKRETYTALTTLPFILVETQVVLLLTGILYLFSGIKMFEM